MNPLHTGWMPQSHGRHVVCRPSNTVSRRHSLHRFRRKQLPIKRHPHDLRGHPVEGSDKLLKHLKIRQDQAHINLELQRSRQCLLASHVVEPVFRTTAEQSSRFRRTHTLQQPRIMQVNAVCWLNSELLVSSSYAILTAPQTVHCVQHPWRGPRPRRVLMNIKEALPRQVRHTQ